jgi:hypothetical protein
MSGAGCSSPEPQQPGRARRARLFEAVDALLAGDLTDAHHYTRPFAEFFPESGGGGRATPEAGGLPPAPRDATVDEHNGPSRDGHRTTQVLVGRDEQPQQQQQQQQQQQHDKNDPAPVVGLALSEAMLLGLDAQVLRMPPLLSPRRATTSSQSTSQHHGANKPMRSTKHFPPTRRRAPEQHNHNQQTQKQNRRTHATTESAAAAAARPLPEGHKLLHPNSTQRRQGSDRRPHIPECPTPGFIGSRKGTPSQTPKLKSSAHALPPCVQVLPEPGSHVGVALPAPLMYTAPPI